jgi:hypothetical protein
MPVAPIPMNAYTCLHDPIAHAKSDHDASEVSARRLSVSAVADVAGRACSGERREATHTTVPATAFKILLAR